jgi:hypothetical protein
VESERWEVRVVVLTSEEPCRGEQVGQRGKVEMMGKKGRGEERETHESQKPFLEHLQLPTRSALRSLNHSPQQSYVPRRLLRHILLLLKLSALKRLSEPNGDFRSFGSEVGDESTGDTGVGTAGVGEDFEA